MTRQEFIENVDTIDELLNACRDINFDLDVYSEDERNDEIENELIDMIRGDGWEYVRDYLNDIPTGYDFYCKDAWGAWEGRECYDINDLKEEVLRYADDNDLFDAEEEREECEDDLEEDDDPVELGCDMDDFLRSGSDTLRAILECEDAERMSLGYALQQIIGF